MCVVSQVMDQYQPYFPPHWPYRGPWIRPTEPPFDPDRPLGPPSITPVVDEDKLRKLIESFKKAVEAAREFDAVTDQPDCEDPEKAELIKRVEALEQKLEELKNGKS